MPCVQLASVQDVARPATASSAPGDGSLLLVADHTVGKLVKWLRLVRGTRCPHGIMCLHLTVFRTWALWWQLGVDCEVVSPGLGDAEVIAFAMDSGRRLLTRRRKLLQRRHAKSVWCVAEARSPSRSRTHIHSVVSWSQRPAELQRQCR